MAEEKNKGFRKFLGVPLTELFGRARNVVAYSFLYKITKRPYLGVRNIETESGREKAFFVKREQALLNILKKLNSSLSLIDDTWAEAMQVRKEVAQHYDTLKNYFVHQKNPELTSAIATEGEWVEKGPESMGMEKMAINILDVPIKFDMPKERKLFFWAPGFQRINPGQDDDISEEDIENMDSDEWRSLDRNTKQKVIKRIRGRLWTEKVRYFGKESDKVLDWSSQIFNEDNKKKMIEKLKPLYNVSKDYKKGESEAEAPEGEEGETKTGEEGNANITADAIVEGVAQAFTELIDELDKSRKDDTFHEFLNNTAGILGNDLMKDYDKLYKHSIEKIAKENSAGKICFAHTMRICQPFIVDWEKSKIKIATLKEDRAGLMKKDYGDVAPGLDEFGMPYEVDDEGNILRDIWENRKPVRVVSKEFIQPLDPLWNSAFNENVFDMFRDQVRDARYNQSTYTIYEYAMRLAIGPLKEFENYGWGGRWISRLGAKLLPGGDEFSRRYDGFIRAASIRPRFQKLFGKLDTSFIMRLYNPPKAFHEETLFRGKIIRGERTPAEFNGNRSTSNLSPAFDLRGLSRESSKELRFLGKKRYYGTPDDGFAEVDLVFKSKKPEELEFDYNGRVKPSDFIGPAFSTRGTALFFMIYTIAMIRRLKEIHETFDDITNELDAEKGGFDIGITNFGGRQMSPFKVTGKKMALELDKDLAKYNKE